MVASIELKGFTELERKLAGLEPKIAKKVMKKSLREGAKIVQRKARINANSKVGGKMGELIAKFIKIRTWTRPRRFYKGVSLEVSATGDDFFVDYGQRGRNYIPAAIEYGHDNVAPISFMRSAWDSTKRAVLIKTERELKTGIEEVAKK